MSVAPHSLNALTTYNPKPIKSVLLTIPDLIRNNYSAINSNERNNSSDFSLRNKLFRARNKNNSRLGLIYSEGLHDGGGCVFVDMGVILPFS